MTIKQNDNQTASASAGRIIITGTETGARSFQIPAEGFSYKSLFTLLIIVLWLLLIMIWTILLFQYGGSWALISLPFWLLGIVTLRLSLKVIFATQEILVSPGDVTIIKKEGSNTSHITLKKNKIETIAFVEGAFKSLAGITKKGIYPAIISENEAFGFGERCTKDEKQFLLDSIKNIILN